MKIVTVFVLMIASLLVGCSTVSGAIRGVGDDVKNGTDAVANWIKSDNKTEKK